MHKIGTLSLCNWYNLAWMFSFIRWASDFFVRSCYISESKSLLKIYLPNRLLDSSIQWYQLALIHVGALRLYDIMSLHFLMPNWNKTLIFWSHHEPMAPREAALLIEEKLQLTLLVLGSSRLETTQCILSLDQLLLR